MKINTFLKQYPDSKLLWQGTLDEDIKQKVLSKMISNGFGKGKVRCFFIGRNSFAYYSEGKQ